MVTLDHLLLPELTGKLSLKACAFGDLDDEVLKSH